VSSRAFSLLRVTDFVLQYASREVVRMRAKRIGDR